VMGNGADAADIDVIAECRRLHAAIDAFDQAAADALDISRGDLRCLNLLEHGALSPTALASALRMTTGSVTALVDRLESKQLVNRDRHPDDRRAILVSATPKVFATLGLTYRRCAERLEALVKGYPTSQRRLAIKVLADTAAAWKIDDEADA